MSMLCTTCDRRPNCLPVALAQQDAALRQLLQNLQACHLQTVPLPIAASPTETHQALSQASSDQTHSNTHSNKCRHWKAIRNWLSRKSMSLQH